MAVYFGKYRALVLKLDDPEKRGRIKVQCPEMYGDYESPWCEPCFANAVDGAGDFNLPPVGEGVWIEFEKGDPQYPIYTGGWWTASKTPIIDYTLAPETRKIGKGGSSINFEKDGANENVNVVTDNFLVNGAPISLVIPVEVSDEAYDATAWNGVVSLAPSKNALRDKFEALASSYGISQNSPVKVSAADVATGEYARFTTTGLESRTITEVLTDLKTVDGTGSGLDADLLDGKHASELTEITFEKGAGADSGNSTTKWCRIATFQMTARFARISTTILITGGASTGGLPYTAMLHLSVVQQNVMGEPPFGRLCIGNNTGLSTTSVKAIMTAMTSSVTEFQIWIQSVHTYKTFKGKVLDEYNPGTNSSYALSGWVAEESLPDDPELSVVQLG